MPLVQDAGPYLVILQRPQSDRRICTDNKVLCPIVGNTQFAELIDAEPAKPPGFNNFLNGLPTDARYAQEALKISRINVYREAVHIAQCPHQLRIHLHIQVRMLFIQQFMHIKTIKTQ
ncbi:hypothetical protein D3C86_1480560 [compost metagenome]